LIQSKIYCVFLVLEGMCKGEAIVALVFFVGPFDSSVRVGDVITTLIPSPLTYFILRVRKDGHSHSLLIHRCVFNLIDYVESVLACSPVPHPKAKPLTITMSVAIIF
jgi:hypothetical protein